MKPNPNVLILGETIIDKYNDTNEIGGAPLNFASHFKMLGGKASIISAIGNDTDGKAIIDFMKKIELNTDTISANNYNTGSCIIRLNNGIPEYNIVSPAAYDYLDETEIPIKDYDCLYFGTLIQRSKHNRDLIASQVKQKKFENIFCDLNLRNDCYERDSCFQCLNNGTIIKISQEEAPLLKAFNLFEYSDKEQMLLKNITKSFENIEQIIYTKGSEGSIVFDRKDFYYFRAPHTEVISTVGAGDSYSAAYLYYYLVNRDIPTKERIRISGNKATELSAKVVEYKEAVPMKIYI